MAISLLGAGCSHNDLSEEFNEESSEFVSLNQLQNRGIDGYYVLETDSPYNGEVIDYYENNQIKYRVQKNDPLIKVAEGLGIYIGETN